MPAYLIQNRQGMILSSFPFDSLRSFPGLKRIPYSNNTDIQVGVKVILPHQKHFQDIPFSWKLYSKTNKKILKSGENILQISGTKAKFLRTKKDIRDKSINVDWWEKGVTFTKSNAINIGHLSDFEPYVLKIVLRNEAMASEEISILEFTLHDCDEFGMHYSSALFSAGLGLVGGVLASIIFYLFIGGK